MHLDDKTVHESMVVEENNDQSLRNAREESKDLGRDYFDILQVKFVYI